MGSVFTRWAPAWTPRTTPSSNKWSVKWCFLSRAVVCKKESELWKAHHHFRGFGWSLYCAGPLTEARRGSEGVLRPHQAQPDLCPLLRRQQQRHPQETPQHGGEDLRVSVSRSAESGPGPAQVQRPPMLEDKGLCLTCECSGSVTPNQLPDFVTTNSSQQKLLPSFYRPDFLFL